MTTRTTEIWVGIFVAAGLASLFMLAMKVSNLSAFSGDEGFTIYAQFEDASGLKVRSPVTMGGVRIGRVTDIRFDPKELVSVVTMQIESQYDTLPVDSSASIYTAGLLGEKYIGLEAGAGGGCEDAGLEAELEAELGGAPAANPAAAPGSTDCENGYLKEGSVIKLTQDSLVLEKLIGQFVSQFLTSDDGGNAPKGDAQ
ncbi:MAG TPA: outer membrane lipid asymmetry maintenance protein MlaD [Gammaproteobacteria bacterium]|nr:outer membrane lipid asymmetry maintenance protein MlaD [Gammaproteobacteria bacterium]